MASIRKLGKGEDVQSVRELFWEYLEWANSRLNEEFGIDLEIRTMHEHSMADLEMFLPPTGCLLLAFEGDQLAGIACMRKIKEDIAEIKRMYVRSAFRGRGIGRQLLECLIEDATAIGYPRIRLDSTRFMKAAHSLYRSAGFQEIDPYPESEIPAEFQEHWVFMEKSL
jgi:GNAT superfamily N-acetyltransferase